MNPQPPKYAICDIVRLARLNNDPDNDQYNIFYFDGDLNFSWEAIGSDHSFDMDPWGSISWGTIDEYGIMQDDFSLAEDVGTNFLVIDTKFPALEFGMGFYVLVSLTTNRKHKEDYFKVDALADKIKD